MRINKWEGKKIGIRRRKKVVPDFPCESGRRKQNILKPNTACFELKDLHNKQARARSRVRDNLIHGRGVEL